MCPFVCVCVCVFVCGWSVGCVCVRLCRYGFACQRLRLFLSLFVYKEWFIVVMVVGSFNVVLAWVFACLHYSLFDRLSMRLLALERALCA